jgi:hypothetical protein
MDSWQEMQCGSLILEQDLTDSLSTAYLALHGRLPRLSMNNMVFTALIDYNLAYSTEKIWSTLMKKIDCFLSLTHVKQRPNYISEKLCIIY